jgi:uncharacterized membrane protein YebE (DUF533 family)
MINTNNILEQLLGKGGELAGRAGVSQPTVDKVTTFARENPLLLGGVAGLLLGSAGKDVAKIGGLAALGGLAYTAYRKWQAGQGTTPADTNRTGGLLPPPAESPFAIKVEGDARLGEALVLVMIAAAKADGQIDDEERGRIEQRLSLGGFSPDDANFLRLAVNAPVDLDRIVNGARTPKAAAEIYTAAVLAARPDTPAERGFLAMLSARLNLAPGLAESIEQTVRGAQA